MAGTLLIELENVGGIGYTHREITDRTTFVRGPNAANKSSFLKGLLFALGVNTVPVQNGADEARIHLSLDDRQIERVAHRTENGLEITGDTWIEDPDDVVLLERFAARLETNPLRNAVARNDDVESLLKEPMNIETLEEGRVAKMRRKRELSEAVESTDDVDRANANSNQNARRSNPSKPGSRSCTTNETTRSRPTTNSKNCERNAQRFDPRSRRTSYRSTSWSPRSSGSSRDSRISRRTSRRA